MKIGIIGPSKIENILEINPHAEKIVVRASKVLRKNEIVLVPDKGSVSEFFAKRYLIEGGKGLFSLIPIDDKEFGCNWLNLGLGVKINCGTWRNQPEKLNEETQIFVCLGYATGVLIEIAYSKWFNKKPVFIIKELVSKELPKDAIRGLDLRYISIDELEEKISDER